MVSQSEQRELLLADLLDLHSAYITADSIVILGIKYTAVIHAVVDLVLNVLCTR